jgi:hypothetical protein
MYVSTSCEIDGRNSICSIDDISVSVAESIDYGY